MGEPEQTLLLKRALFDVEFDFWATRKVKSDFARIPVDTLRYIDFGFGAPTVEDD